MKNLKSPTGGGKMRVDMKKHLFWMLAPVLFVSMLFTACKTGSGGGSVDQEIYALDISKDTNWDYMVFCEDGSSIVYKVNAAGKPTTMYLKPKKDSDKGFTYLFKENGLPDKMIYNGYIAYFGNFNGHTFDLAVINPSGEITYYPNRQTDINWNKKISELGQGRSIFGESWSVFRESLGFISTAIDIGTCIATPFFPPAGIGCATFIVKEVGHIVADNFFEGYTQDIAHTVIDVFGCVSDIGNVFDFIGVADDCISAFTDVTDMLSGKDIDDAVQKTKEINEVIRKIDGDALTTTIPPDLLQNLYALDIQINNGNNPPNIEGVYKISPCVLVRSNFNDSYSPGYKFSDGTLTFSNQNNARMTVDAKFVQASQNSNAENSYITGNGNKFSVFCESSGLINGSPFASVEIYSGEITATGISNYQNAFITIQEAPTSIKRGQGRLVSDGDNFSEKTSSARALLNETSSETLLSGIYSSGD